MDEGKEATISNILEAGEKNTSQTRRRVREKSEKEIAAGDLMTMHKEGRSNSDETVHQVVELNKDAIGNMHSITLSDGEYVSHNIKTLPSSPLC